MKILITGASGYVGAKIYEFLKDTYEVVGTYSKNQLFPELVHLELTDDQAVKDLVNQVKPEVIIHAAAIPSNGIFNEDPETSQRINVDGTKSIVEVAKAKGIKVIFISSFAAFNPSNGYGQSKVDGEELVSQLQDYVILRLSLVIGLSPNTTTNNTFNKILKDIENKQPTAYDTSWEMEITYLGHLCELIRALIERPEINNQMVPVISKGLTSKYKIAIDILLEFGIEAKSEDKQMNIPLPQINYEMYTQLGLPESKYENIIREIILELKHKYGQAS